MTKEMATEKETNKIRNACGLLYLATRTIRILTNISWPNSVREKFFAQGARELPVVEYPEFDPSESLERLVLAKTAFNFPPMINEWLNITAYNIETSAQMLAARGTPDFFSILIRALWPTQRRVVGSGNDNIGSGDGV